MSSSPLPHQRQALDQILATMRPRLRTTTSPCPMMQIAARASRMDSQVTVVTIRPRRRLVVAGVIRKRTLVKGSLSPEMRTR
jgi:hypothetical protein